MTVREGRDARNFAPLLLAVTLLALALRLAWLPGQPPLGDDLLSGASAINFVERSQVGPTMWHHPHLRDLLVYASMSVLGNGKLGLVFPSLLLGALAVPAVGFLGRRLAGAHAGLLGALLLAADPLHIDYSRQAIQEVYTSVFGVAGVLFTLRYLDTRRAPWIVAAGVLFGVGVAAKWSVAFSLAVAVAYAAWHELRREEGPAALMAARFALLASALLLLPFAVYLATWAPWFSGGRTPGDWVHLHVAMATEARTHGGFNAATLESPHRAAAWFVWPSHYADAAVGAEGTTPIIAISNPLTWLLTLPAIAWLARAAWRERSLAHALLPALVLANWLPFALAARPIWLHSALAVLPFALAAVAAVLADLWKRGPAPRRLIVAYGVATLIVAAPLWILATGLATRIPGLREAAASYRPASTLPTAAPR